MVSYNPGKYLVPNVSALASQVDEVIVVDNGSSGPSQLYLKELECVGKVKVVYNEENLGIAAALNLGARAAVKAGYDWIATFDQDSHIEPGFFEAMALVWKAYSDPYRVAIISPVYTDQATGVVHSFAKGTKSLSRLYNEVKHTMTSGSLVRAEVFLRVGYFEESLFIDYVDNEFCLRCRDNGFIILESSKSLLLHNLGQSTRPRFFWKRPIVTNHSHLRRYYSTRNRVFLYKRYLRCRFGWVVGDVLLLCKETVKIIVFENNVPQKLYYIVKGGYHGFVGKMGRYE